MKKRRFLVADARSWFQPDGLDQAIETLAELFQACAPFMGLQASRPDTLTALLDGEPPLIDDAVHGKRVWLLEQGLMMAALHPSSDLGPLGQATQRGARPFRADNTFLSVRWAVPADRVFTRKDPDLDGLLDRWLRSCKPCR